MFKRPLFSGYKTPEKRFAESSTRLAKNLPEKVTSKELERIRLGIILGTALPLLEKHVEKSPLEVWEPIKRNFGESITKSRQLSVLTIGCWPLIISEKGASTTPNKKQLILSENGKFCEANLSLDKNNFSFFVGPYYDGRMHDITGTEGSLPAGTNIDLVVAGISDLLEEVDVEFIVPEVNTII